MPFFSETLIGEKRYSITSGGLRIYLDESKTENSILLSNAIVLEDQTKEYAVGEIIPEEEIESYFVWTKI